MKQDFTDLLDNYLEASKMLQEARDGYTGYSFGYYHEALIRRESEARNALNAAFERATGENNG